MDSPTHKDAFLSLLSSCLPCRSSTPPLDGLHDEDDMSLHSTYRPHTRRRRKTGVFCGLFGQPRGQIRLESDDEIERRRYDSDAAPLPDAAIRSISAQPGRKPESPEEELARLRAEKAARKARRKDRRERKRQLAIAGEFEGFIGSDLLPISPPSTTTSTPGIDESIAIDDSDDADADMGAAVYTQSSSGTRSSSSGTSTSMSSRRPFASNNALGLGIQRGPPSPLAQSHTPNEPNEPNEPNDQSNEPNDQSNDKAEPKIRIPTSTPGAGPGPRTMENSPRLAPTLDSPRAFPSGFPAAGFSPGLGLGKSAGFPSPGLGKSNGFPSPGLALGLNGGNSSFPSPGLGSPGVRSGSGIGARSASPFNTGPPRKGSLTAGMGVALANRGDQVRG